MGILWYGADCSTAQVAELREQAAERNRSRRDPPLPSAGNSVWKRYVGKSGGSETTIETHPSTTRPAEETMSCVPFSFPKRTDFQPDLLVQLRHATGFNITIDALYMID